MMRRIPDSFSPALARSKPPHETLGWLRWGLLVAVALLLPACAGGVRNTSRSFSTVIVDAGHGGHDFGTRSSKRIAEKDAALDVAKRLNSQLLRRGFSTVVTRTNDTFIPLDTRVAISNRTRGAVFVSVHFNEARRRRDIHGAETYYHSAASKELAQRIVSRLGQLPGGNNRGIRTARFRVLRNNKNPAVLVECGYLSNAGEAARIAGSGYREKIADAIADAISEQKR